MIKSEGAPNYPLLICLPPLRIFFISNLHFFKIYTYWDRKGLGTIWSSGLTMCYEVNIVKCNGMALRNWLSFCVFVCLITPRFFILLSSLIDPSTNFYETSSRTSAILILTRNIQSIMMCFFSSVKDVLLPICRFSRYLPWILVCLLLHSKRAYDFFWEVL